MAFVGLRALHLRNHLNGHGIGRHTLVFPSLDRTFRQALAFILKLLMIIGGVLIIVFARTDWEREKRESSE